MRAGDDSGIQLECQLGLRMTVGIRTPPDLGDRRGDVTHKQNPVKRSSSDMIGNVHRSRGRRPNLSMMKIVGIAKIVYVMVSVCRAMRLTFSIPKPQEASRASISVNPALVKMLAV